MTSKFETVKAKLIENDNALLDDYIKKRRPVSWFLEEFDISREYFYAILRDLPEELTSRADYIMQHLTEGFELAKQGIPLEKIVEEPNIAPIFEGVKRIDMNYLRNAFITRAKTRDIMTNDDRRYVVQLAKLEDYIGNIKPFKDLDMYLAGQSDLDLSQIAEKHNISYTRTQKIKTDILEEGRPLPHIPEDLFYAIKRNIDICTEYTEHEALPNELAKKYGVDEHLIHLVLDSYMPIINGDI